MPPANVVAIVNHLNQRKRFRPFIIEFHGKEQIEVKHPEVVEVQGTILVFQDRDGSQSVFDGSSVSRIIVR